MEALEERTVLASAAYTPTAASERQIYRAMRPRWRIVLLCILFGALFVFLLVRVGIQVAKIFVLDLTVYTVISLAMSALQVLLFVFLFVWMLIAPRRAARQHIKQLKEMYPEPPTMRCAFESDGIALQSGAWNGVRFAYASIAKCLETEDLFVLQSKQKQVFSIEKQTLTGVDVPGFRALIREKCPKAKCSFDLDGGE